MIVLSIDTALEACSAAVFDSERDAIIAANTAMMARGHAEALMPLLDGVMRAAGIDFFDLDRVAVTVGPGSFTGLRVGIAAARGIGLAAKKPVLGVTTLAALAAPSLAADSNQPVAAVIDGRHRHVYFELYGPQGRVLLSPRIIPVEEAAHAAEAASASLVGSGARMMTEVWSDPMNLPRCDDRGAPDIAWVARLGARLQLREAPPKPLYLRPPDAHPQTAAILPRRT